MKREDRKQAILDLLVSARAVDLDDLALRFGVSKMTVHRDLDDLAQSGVLRKVRGGATIESGTQYESDFRIRALQDGEAKERMSVAAAELIEPGMTVMVNDGSMAAVLSSALLRKAPLTVITNNVALIDRLRDQPGIKLIALGGQYDAKYMGYFGVVTEAALARLRADLAFVSTPAVEGCRAFHMDGEVVRTKRGMMDAARQKVLLINHKRFGRPALHLLADLHEFDAIITDDAPSAEDQALLAAAGIRLTIAKDAT